MDSDSVCDLGLDAEVGGSDEAILEECTRMLLMDPTFRFSDPTHISISLVLRCIPCMAPGLVFCKTAQSIPILTIRRTVRLAQHLSKEKPHPRAQTQARHRTRRLRLKKPTDETCALEMLSQGRTGGSLTACFFEWELVLHVFGTPVSPSVCTLRLGNSGHGDGRLL